MAWRVPYLSGVAPCRMCVCRQWLSDCLAWGQVAFLCIPPLLAGLYALLGASFPSQGPRNLGRVGRCIGRPSLSHAIRCSSGVSLEAKRSDHRMDHPHCTMVVRWSLRFDCSDTPELQRIAWERDGRP